MNNSDNPDLEQEEQDQREQELREQQRAAHDELRQSTDGGDEGKDPVIINRGG
ncbi:MAG: hypothetical protein QM719_10065 [Thermomonas sp.]